MSDRLVIYETQVVPLGSTVLHSRANSKLDGLPADWEVIQIIDAAKWMKVLPGDEKLLAVVRRALPHPAPPMDLEGNLIGHPGWFTDPLDDGVQRFFDGEFWTVHIRVDEAWTAARASAIAGVQDELDRLARLEEELALAPVHDGVPEAGLSAPGWYRDADLDDQDTEGYRYFDGASKTEMTMTQERY